MVKDAQGRFEEIPLWGRGWGWGLLKSDDPNRNVATDYRIDCLECHLPAQTTDCVYTKGYPSLRSTTDSDTLSEPASTDPARHIDVP